MSGIRFDGRVVVVTGAGGGLGRAYSLELARRGAKVLVNDLGGSGSGQGASSSMADQVVEEIRAFGGEALANHESVATRAGGEAIIGAALDAWGKIDVCINNAGILRNNRFEDLRDDQIDPIIDVHLKGAFYVSQPAYRAMRKQGYGRFLFTASASGMFGHAWQANYAAAKSGMVGLSNVVALEGSAYGIQSNVILPTSGDTRLAQEMSDGFLEIPMFAEVLASTQWAPPERGSINFNTPLAVYLVSEQCKATHHIYSSSSGRYARVAIAAAEGWVSAAGPDAPSVEDLAANFDRISDASNFTEPMSVYNEITEATLTGRRKGIYE